MRKDHGAVQPSVHRYTYTIVHWAMDEKNAWDMLRYGAKVPFDGPATVCKCKLPGQRSRTAAIASKEPIGYARHNASELRVATPPRGKYNR